MRCVRVWILHTAVVELNTLMGTTTFYVPSSQLPGPARAQLAAERLRPGSGVPCVACPLSRLAWVGP